MAKVDYSIVIPIYKNKENILTLLARSEEMQSMFVNNGISSEFIYVVDGCPDGSYEILKKEIKGRKFDYKVFSLNRNVGQAQAIKFGMKESEGVFIANMAADLQEPAQLFLDMYTEVRSNQLQIVFASREKRNDGFFTDLNSRMYWNLWSKILKKDIPAGGMDVFCMTREARDRFVESSNTGTALIASLLDMNFPHGFVPYERAVRIHGKSAWTIKKKLKMVSDSVYGFTDLPLRLINYIGLAGIGVSVVLGTSVIAGKLMGRIESPGFAALITTILFTNSLLLIALSIATNYIWRIFLNSKNGNSFFKIEEYRKGERN